MKICWDNLENLKYVNKSGYWYKRTKPYIYIESCKICDMDFLSDISSSGKYCSSECSRNDKEKYKRSSYEYVKEYIENEGYKLISREYINNASKLKIKCPNNHIFETSYGNFKVNRRCRYCYLEKLKGKNHPAWKGGVTKNNIPLYDTYSHKISFAEQVRRSLEDEKILEVKCTYCGKWYIPKTSEVGHRIKSLNGNGNGEGRLYCSDECKKECPIFNMSKYPKGYKKASSREVQPELRQLVFKRDRYKCRKCNNKKNLHCHHIEGIRWEPLESADIDKCITYCKKCHKEVHEKENCGYKDMKCKENDS